jgi:hypothetical protein
MNPEEIDALDEQTENQETETEQQEDLWVEEIPAEGEAQEQAETPAAEETAAEVPAVARPAYVPTDNPHEARLRGLVDPEVFEAMQAYNNFEAQKLAVSMTASQLSANVATARYPELFKVKGDRIQGIIATMDANQRSQPNAVEAAIHAAAYQESSETGDLAGTFRRYADMMGGQAPAAAQARPKPVSTPPRPSQQQPASTGFHAEAPRERESQLIQRAGQLGFNKRNFQKLIDDGEVD